MCTHDYEAIGKMSTGDHKRRDNSITGAAISVMRCSTERFGIPRCIDSREHILAGKPRAVFLEPRRGLRPVKMNSNSRPVITKRSWKRVAVRSRIRALVLQAFTAPCCILFRKIECSVLTDCTGSIANLAVRRLGAIKRKFYVK